MTRLCMVALLLAVCQSRPAAAYTPAASTRVPPAQFARFHGTAVVNGSARGSITLDLATVDPGRGRVVGVLTAGDGLVGQGVLQGSWSGETLRLRGVVRYEVPSSGGMTSRGAWEVALTATRTGGDRIRGRYHLTGIGAGGEQDAVFEVARSGTSPAASPPTGILGSWEVVVGSSAYSAEVRRGDAVERSQGGSVGAPAGRLTLAADGRFSWRTPSGTVSGPMLPYRPLAGGTAWLVFDQSRVYYAFVMPRTPGTLWLFSPEDESERLRARRGG